MLEEKKELMEGPMVNQVFEEDCLSCMKRLPNQCVDMVLCDLPYGTTQNAWDEVIPLEPLWKEYLRVIKPNGAMVFTCQGRYTADMILSNPKHFRYKWVWVKSKPTNFLNAKRQPLRKHEDICVFYKKPPTYHPQMEEGKPYDKGERKLQQTGSYGAIRPVKVVNETGERYPTDVLYFCTAESEGKVYHPTQKPVALGRYLVRTYTEPGDVVLDNAFGSGSFLVAALLEGRNFIGMEKNEQVALFKEEKIDYIRVAKERLKEAFSSLSDEKRGSIVMKNLVPSFA